MPSETLIKRQGNTIKLNGLIPRSSVMNVDGATYLAGTASTLSQKLTFTSQRRRKKSELCFGGGRSTVFVLAAIVN